MPVLLHLLATAHAADNVQSANQVGMGRTGLAAADDNAAISLNPGLLALTERYDFEGLFRYGPDGGLGWGASAMDARTSDVLAGGLFYSGDATDPPLTEDTYPAWTVPGEDIPNKHRFHDFGLGVATPLADRKVSLGVGLLLGYYDHDRIGDGWRFDASAGAGFAPTDTLTLGVMARGFVPWAEEDVPLSTGAGVRFHPGTFAAEVDAAWFPDVTEAVPITTSAGIEQGIRTGRLRAGWRYDAPTTVHALSFGAGLVGDGAALEYAAWIPVSGDVSLTRTEHQISIRFAASAEIEEP